MVNRAEAGGFQPDQESSVQTPEVSIENIRQAALDLKQKVAQGKLLREQDLESKVQDHAELNRRLLELRETLAAAKETQDYFNSIDAAGELPADSRPQMEEINATVANLENQLGQIESKINFMATQPQILDRLHEMALKERDGELKEQEIKGTIEELTKENDTIAQEVKSLALEQKATLVEFNSVRDERAKLEESIKALTSRVRADLDWNKHRSTISKLSEIPTPAQLEAARAELGVFRGKEKAAIDLVLNHRADLERFHDLTRRYDELYKQIYNESGGKRKKLIDRIKKHIIKAWEAHEKTGIPHNNWGSDGIDVPGAVYNDLVSKVEKLAGVTTVTRGSERKKEYDAKDPEKKTIYLFWDSLHGYSSDEGGSLSGVHYHKPEIK